MTRDRRGTTLRLLLLAALLLAPFGTLADARDDDSTQARMTKGRWQDPGPEHTIEPHGTITERAYPKYMVTKLPPAEDLTEDLPMTVILHFDVSKGTDAPLSFTQRSGILTITPNPEDLKDNVIQPSAIDGDKAKVRIDVSAHAKRLNFIKPVYFEQLAFWLQGDGKRRAILDWTWKPNGKHDEPLFNDAPPKSTFNQ